MYDRMVHEHGYSIRKLAEKLGKDKGYLENRLRLADAPEEIRELVSLRKDTVSHAYELLKVEDPKKRRKLAAQVASGELSLVKLRERIEGRRPRATVDDGCRSSRARGGGRRRRPPTDDAADDGDWDRPAGPRGPIWRTTRSSQARHQLTDAVEDLVAVLRVAGRRPLDPGGRPGEPREVPDDRQAQARERDRRRPDRRRRVAGPDSLPENSTKPAPSAPASSCLGTAAVARRGGCGATDQRVRVSMATCSSTSRAVAVAAAPECRGRGCALATSGRRPRGCRSRPASRSGRPRSRACRGCRGGRRSATSASGAPRIEASVPCRGLGLRGLGLRRLGLGSPSRAARSGRTAGLAALVVTGCGAVARRGRRPADRARTARAIRRLRRRRLGNPRWSGPPRRDRLVSPAAV